MDNKRIGLVVGISAVLAVWSGLTFVSDGSHFAPRRDPDRATPRTDSAASRVGASAASPRRIAVERAQRMADGRYVVRQNADALEAKNPEQTFDIAITRGRARIAAEGEFALELSLASAGRAGASVAVEAHDSHATGNRVHVVRAGLTEWFVNGPLGLEQGFELAARPDGEGPLRFELDVSGLAPQAHAGYVALRDAEGLERARYSDLYALDAEGDELPAALRVEGQRIVLEIDDTHATYPLVIDPLLSTQQARLSASEVPKSGRYGTAVASTTISPQGTWTVVGAPNDDHAGVDAGAAYLYRRNVADTGWDLITRLEATDPEAGAHFGAAVAIGAVTALQVRVLVGAPNRASGGKVYATNYVSATLAPASTTSWLAPSSAPGDEFGAAIGVDAIVGGTAFVVGSPGMSSALGAAYAYRNDILEATLTPVGGAAGDRFGASLPPTYRTSGAVLIGSPGDDASAGVVDSGSVYSFVRASGPPAAWAQESKVSAAVPQANAHFGASVFRMTDTEYLTGEPGRGNGVAHRLTRSNGSLTITGSVSAADGAAGDAFGSCVAFSEAGAVDHVIIGSPGVDQSMFLGGQGALYRYTLDASFTFTFVQRYIGASIGAAAGTSCTFSSVSSAPRVALYGEPGDDTEGTDAGAVPSQNFSTNTAETTLVPGSVRTNALGRAVAVDGDTAVVGAPFDDDAGPNTGAVYVYVRAAGVWTQQAKLLGAGGQLFGGSVALEGDVLAFGSQNGGANAVLVSRRTGTSWSTPTALTPSPLAIGDAFGTSVALRGGTLVVGAPGVNGAGTDRGSVYVFVNAAGSFTQQAVLSSASGQDLDGLGYAVAVDGNLLVAGAPGRDGGGGAVDIGVAYVFARAGVTWAEQAVLAGPPSAGSAFGKAVALDGARAAISAPAVPVGGASMGVGSVRTFVQNGFAWPLEGTITLASGVLGDEFGASIALRGTVFAIGAPGRDSGALVNVGMVLPHQLVSGAWVAQTAITEPASDDSSDDNFGRSVSISAQSLVSGAPGLDADATDAGGAYVHELIKSNGDACGGAGECGSGFCADGVCCNAACGGGAATDCQACSAAAGGSANGTCTALSAAAAPSVTCRAANPGGCDLAEVCTAGSVACPADSVAPDGVSCGGTPSGLCDAQDTCTAGACTANFATSGVVCRVSLGECDVAETCTGSATTCPVDVQVPNDTACGVPFVSGGCDVVDYCKYGLCVMGVESAGTPCRVSNGECDATESCDGMSPVCPADAPNALNGAACGLPLQAGGCDLPDTCLSGACVVGVQPGGTECRVSTGSCDSAETCTGGSPLCPSDVNGCCTGDVDCNDNDPCTPDTCNLARGVCMTGAPIAGCCISDAQCAGATACMPMTCNVATNTCDTTDLGPTCCTMAMDCDDNDACTADTCSANACSHTPVPGCGMADAGVSTDAGMVTNTDAGLGSDAGGGTDAGVESDASVQADAGTPVTSSTGGCGCSLTRSDAQTSSGGSLTALAILAAAVLSMRARRSSRPLRAGRRPGYRQ